LVFVFQNAEFSFANSFSSAMPVSISALMFGLKALDLHKTVTESTTPGIKPIIIMKWRPVQAGQGLQAQSCIH
jgi:hypothetical protein